MEWTYAEFASRLRDPLQAFLSQARLTNQIHFVVLSMGIPYRITGPRANSTTAALFYGYKTNALFLNNSYAKSEGRFPADQPVTAPGASFLTMMLTAETLDQSKRIVDQGVQSDATAPGATAWLAKSPDAKRNMRFWFFDNAVFNTRLLTNYSLLRTNLVAPSGLTNLLGFETGADMFSVSAGTFVPGAMADSLTSFGGQIFEPSGQTNLLAFIDAGATASYGTVVEPLAVVQKFPNPLVYFYQARGFSIAESYYQGIEIPVEGLLVGEPLAAPFRRQLSGGWEGLDNDALLSGATNLHLSFRANWPGGVIDAVDLYTNGRVSQVLTNLPPRPGNRIAARFNGYEVAYEIPTNATLKSIAAEYAALLNSAPHSNFTKVLARAYGDRIELQSLATNLPPGTFEFVDRQATNGVVRTYLANVDRPWVDPFVSGNGWDGGGGFRLQLRAAPGTPAVLRASTNLADWVPLLTNSTGGAFSFVDAAAVAYPRRFYQLGIPAQSVPPRLATLGFDPTGRFGVAITAPAERSYFIQASSDLQSWSDIFTNETGGATTFSDSRNVGSVGQFYRTRSANPGDYSAVSVVATSADGGNVVRVQEAQPGDGIVWASTNGVDWSLVYRHGAGAVIQTEVFSERGAADLLTTGLRAARPDFLASTAWGYRKGSVTATNLASAGGFIRLVAGLTNGGAIMVAATNSVGNANLKALVQQLADAVNNHAELMGEDGLALEDIADAAFGAVNFTIRARGAGYEAAAATVVLEVSSNVIANLTSTVALDSNRDDLRSRNHLYFSAGLPTVTLEVPLDTTSLPDGYNELCAVAYEGTHVNSQTHRKVSVVVRNTPLEAQLELMGGTAPLTVTNTLAVAVAANTNSVSEILLYGTGGFLAGATNQSAANFQVQGAMLGAGEHSIYAVVTTTNGFRYRTAPQNFILRRP